MHISSYFENLLWGNKSWILDWQWPVCLSFSTLTLVLFVFNTDQRMLVVVQSSIGAISGFESRIKCLWVSEVIKNCFFPSVMSGLFMTRMVSIIFFCIGSFVH